MPPKRFEDPEQPALFIPTVQQEYWLLDDAACRETGDNFELENEKGNGLRGREKREETDRIIGTYCMKCEAIADCRADALRTDDQKSIRAGLTPDEREPLHKALKANGGLTVEQWLTQHTFEAGQYESPLDAPVSQLLARRRTADRLFKAVPKSRSVKTVEPEVATEIERTA